MSDETSDDKLSHEWVRHLMDWLSELVNNGALTEDIVNGEIGEIGAEGRPIARVVIGIGQRASGALDHCVRAIDAARGAEQVPLVEQPEENHG